MYLDKAECENQELKARLTTLKRRVEAQEDASRAQRERLERFVDDLSRQASILKETLSAIADGVVVCDREQRFLHFNAGAEALLGVGKMDVSPERWSSVYGLFFCDKVTPLPPEQIPLTRAMRGESVDDMEFFVRNANKPEGAFLLASSRPIHNGQGAHIGAVVIFRDVSERRGWERQLTEQLAREKEKNDTLARLRSAVEELSTPILEVWDDVLALPVIGVVDSRRSAEMMERLLAAVEETQCRFVIIDITGVEVVDSATADRLLKLVRAVEILGAQCLLTGARGAVAQTLVSIGANLGSILTYRNLKRGIGECLRLMDAQHQQARDLDGPSARALALR